MNICSVVEAVPFVHTFFGAFATFPTMLWLAFAVAATSGRAHRAQHRRQAQARRSRYRRGYTNASSPASSDLSTLPAVGFCRDTRKEPGHCESGLLGWWSTADLEQCAARCRLCAGTNRASACGGRGHHSL